MKHMRYATETADAHVVFQAEDGIRGADVTGVQTCALPIYGAHGHAAGNQRRSAACGCYRRSSHGHVHRGRQYRLSGKVPAYRAAQGHSGTRSEERRVGKECRSRVAPRPDETHALRHRDRRRPCCFSSRRRHTRCGRDWSSDVCSSDLRCTWPCCWKSTPVSCVRLLPTVIAWPCAPWTPISTIRKSTSLSCRARAFWN